MKTMWLTNIERDEDGRVISCEGQCGEEEFYLDSREEIEQVTSQGYTIGNPWVLYDEVRFAEKDYVTERMILALDMQFVQSTRERFRLNLSFRSNMSNEDMDAMIRISDDYKHFSETMAAVRIGKNLILMSEKQLAFLEDCSDMMRYCLFEKVSFDEIDCSQMICCNGFFAYAHINEIDLLHFCTETVKYMIGMFRGVKTDSIDFNFLNTHNVLDMSHMFHTTGVREICEYGEGALEQEQLRSENTFPDSVDFSFLDFANAENVVYMFQNVRADKINLSRVTSLKNVKSMRGMFKGVVCTELDLSNLNTSNIEDMSQLFQHSNIFYIDMQQFDTRNVRYMTGMFSEANVLAFDLALLNTSNVESMAYMFAGCKSPCVDIETFNTKNVKDFVGMFRRASCCILGLDRFSFQSAERMNFMFEDYKYANLHIQLLDLSAGANVYGMFRKTDVYELCIDSLHLRSTPKKMFASCNIRNLTINHAVIEGTDTLEFMFSAAHIVKANLLGMELGNIRDFTFMFSKAVICQLNISQLVKKDFIWSNCFREAYIGNINQGIFLDEYKKHLYNMEEKRRTKLKMEKQHILKKLFAQRKLDTEF